MFAQVLLRVIRRRAGLRMPAGTAVDTRPGWVPFLAWAATTKILGNSKRASNFTTRRFG